MISLLDLGKKLFRNNIIQLILLLVCSTLILLAHKLSYHAIHLSLTQYISGSSINYFQHASFIENVAIPSVAFILSVLLFIWMGVSNFLLVNGEEEKINAVLRKILAISQIIFFCFLLFIGGKVFFHVFIFLLIVAVLMKQVLKGLSLGDQ